MTVRVSVRPFVRVRLGFVWGFVFGWWPVSGAGLRVGVGLAHLGLNRRLLLLDRPVELGRELAVVARQVVQDVGVAGSAPLLVAHRHAHAQRRLGLGMGMGMRMGYGDGGGEGWGWGTSVRCKTAQLRH